VKALLEKQENTESYSNVEFFKIILLIVSSSTVTFSLKLNCHTSKMVGGEKLKSDEFDKIQHFVFNH